MKICHITSLHNRYDSRIFHKECTSIAKDNNEVFLLVNDSFPSEIKNGVKIISIQSRFKSKFHRFFLSSITYKFLKLALLIDADVYHFHDPELLFLGNILINKKKKVIYDIHEDYPKEILFKHWLPQIIRPILSNLFRLTEEYFSKKFNGLIVVVPNLFERFSKINPNTIIVANFPNLNELINFNHFSIKNPLIYIGAITENRGIYQISLASSISNKKMILCGNFLTRNLQNSILNSFNNVKYGGNLLKGDVIKILSNSSIGLVLLLNTPNNYISFPTKLFEYMAAGLPVIASDFPNIRSFVQEGNCGILVNPYDIHEISNKINYLIENPEIAENMGKNGKKLIINKYNWEMEYNKIKNLYNLITS